MTKKEFTSMCSVHHYTGAGRDYNQTAVFFDWFSGSKDGKVAVGFKYCVATYTHNISQRELINLLYDIVTKGEDNVNVPYFVAVDIAQNDLERFKVPLDGNSLNHLIKRTA
jgi:hypothetical protein